MIAAQITNSLTCYDYGSWNIFSYYGKIFHFDFISIVYVSGLYDKSTICSTNKWDILALVLIMLISKLLTDLLYLKYKWLDIRSTLKIE